MSSNSLDDSQNTEQPEAAEKIDQRQPLSLKAGAFALLLATMWAGNPVANKAGLQDAGPLRLGYLRFILGAIVVLIYALATRQSFKVKKREWIPLILLGILFTVQLAFMNVGQDYTSAGHAVVVTTTFPLWTGVFAHFFVPGDRMSRSRTFGTLVAYGGVVAVFYKGFADSSSDFLIGDLLLLGSAVLLGGRQVFLSQLGQGIDQHKLLMAQSVFGIVTFVVASMIFEGNEAFTVTTKLVLALFYTGVLIAGLGFIGQTWLLKRYLPSRVTVLSLSQPIFGVLFSWWILGESIGGELYVGAMLVVIGSALAQRRGKPKATNLPKPPGDASR
ncbi:MAG: DMT family transporter [Chloroflexi bacterium]|jgi:drug/metabolite transporter (DMT)-like permease|nr:DMT family transporter [Chloroflexota bacterium]MBT3863796.1 DMT family transporter [Chloroflexota bacterium]MBT4141986.1 DMT family transporter [Chloroflexota bacterium]